MVQAFAQIWQIYTSQHLHKILEELKSKKLQAVMSERLSISPQYLDVVWSKTSLIDWHFFPNQFHNAILFPSKKCTYYDFW